MNARQLLEEIAQDWFLMTPIFFNTYCTHTLRENTYMRVPFRSGQMRIEYNPLLLETKSKMEVKKFFETEITRILLKHPYHRKPEPYIPELAYLASNLAILQDKRLLEKYKFPPNLAYEKYYWELLKKCDVQEIKLSLSYIFGTDSNKETSVGGKIADGDSGGINSQWMSPVGLWEENLMTAELINSVITSAMLNEKSWGTIPAYIKEKIIASLKVKVDYKKVLRAFRTSIISSRTVLTRFKPSRRRDFDYMGKKYDFDTRLLIAVDVSGSITKYELKKFFSAVNNIFKYGVTSIDIVEFDTELKGTPKTFTKAQRAYDVKGRGGTNFQSVFDFLASADGRKYDGAIIFTDGYAPTPERLPNTRAKVAWVCTEESTWENAKNWMNTFGRSCYIEEK